MLTWPVSLANCKLSEGRDYLIAILSPDSALKKIQKKKKNSKNKYLKNLVPAQEILSISLLATRGHEYTPGFWP